MPSGLSHSRWAIEVVGVAVATLMLPAVAAQAGRPPAISAEVEQIQRAEAALTELMLKRQGLERDSQALAAAIERLKSEPRGLQRDRALADRLATARAKSDELERMQAELKSKAAALAFARRRLLVACDRTLTGKLADADRLDVARLRTAEAAKLATPEAPLGVATVTINPLDGPRELKEKADLLSDAEDKLRRESQRLDTRISDVLERQKLRERSRALDDDLFSEAASNRRVAHAAGASPADRSPAGSARGPTFTGAGAGSDSSGGGDTTVLRNLVDPQTLEALHRADDEGDLGLKVQALRRARTELNALAGQLHQRAQSLADKAEELKHKK